MTFANTCDKHYTNAMESKVKLTPKQENFCLAYLETGNASEAYRRAYDSGKMASETVGRNAFALLENSKIATRLEELRAPVRKKAALTLESHLARLEELSLKAEAAAQYSAAIKAEESRGKAAGLYTDKVDLTNSDGSLKMPQKIVIEAVSANSKD